MKQTIEGWAVHDDNGGFIYACSTKEAAELEVKEGEKYHLYNRNVIPCTIVYDTEK
jgi:hypothetical protein